MKTLLPRVFGRIGVSFLERAHRPDQKTLIPSFSCLPLSPVRNSDSYKLDVGLSRYQLRTARALLKQVQKSFSPLFEWQLEFFSSFTQWCSQNRSRAGTSPGPNQDHRSISNCWITRVTQITWSTVLKKRPVVISNNSIEFPPSTRRIRATTNRGFYAGRLINIYPTTIYLSNRFNTIARIFGIFVVGPTCCLKFFANPFIPACTFTTVSDSRFCRKRILLTQYWLRRLRLQIYWLRLQSHDSRHHH